jgi:hypothetical protein
VFKVGYPADETARIRVLLELGFDSDEPYMLDGVAVSPRGFAAAYIGRRGIGPAGAGTLSQAGRRCAYSVSVGGVVPTAATMTCATRPRSIVGSTKAGPMSSRS